ncbi:type II secretion system protein GspL [Halorhodospira halophila]|uniref:Type II secretion system protein L n=1 Tax=Halorhodospira halophila (strain DSM 244 / SL1) TaxID=349124 RepID=A1WZN9_HALHL|nr:type II secretion system protein GspL [Halorhodospira halophila]ABM63151.1 general secretion pathway protein L [Halorhodospira halophila SL1]MBK1729330.1 type II secretion system protein GspL [Halorhodospira halophila]
MPEYLLIQLPRCDDGRYRFAVVAEGGAILDQGLLRPEVVAPHRAGRRCVGVVPGAQVLVTRVWLPTRRRPRVLQALPYALEEQLTSDLEALHFAIRRIDADGGVHAAVVEHAAMQAWLDEFASLGLEVDALVPENGLLPADSGHWRVEADRNQVVLALGADGFALEPASAPVTLEAALAVAERPPQRLTLQAPAALQTRLESAAAAAEPAPELESRAVDADLLPRLAAWYHPRTAVDLRQGPYARRERWGWLWRPLRPAAALLAVWLLGQGALQWLEVQRLEREAEQLTAEIEQVYRETFPEGRVVNPRVQMEHHLRTIRGDRGGEGGGHLARLLGKAAPALAGDGLRVRTLRLRDGSLEVELDTVDIETLEGLRRALEGDAGLAVEIRSASAREGRVDGRLVIREEESA